MSGTFSTHWAITNAQKVLVAKPERKRPFGILSVYWDGSYLNGVVGCGLDFFGSRWRPVAVSY
jgi:hypothetical protein